MLVVATTTLAGLAAGVGGAAALRRRRLERARALELARKAERIEHVQARTVNTIEDARAEAELLRDRLANELAAAEKTLAEDALRLESRDAALADRDARFESRTAELDGRFEAFKEQQAHIRELRKRLSQAKHEISDAVAAASGHTRQEVIETLASEMTAAAAVAAQRAARHLEEQVTEDLAREMMDLACQRYGAPLPANRLVGVVDLPRSAKLREQILGDDRAVLKAMAEECQVDFNPSGDDQLRLEAPDPYIREIGRLAYDRMVRGGNVSEAIARKAARKAIRDLDKIVADAGNRAARVLKLKRVHPEILHLVGKLLYRTSYTQNQWQHAIESAQLCAMMAEELGLPVGPARRAGLLHDIGKVLWAETEAVGSHAVSGAAYATDRGEIPEIVHPIAAHHNDEKPSSALAHLVAAADALSGARPGARRETIETYKQRVEDLERISNDFKSVKKSYVIQGGRELRIVVDPNVVDDLEAVRISNAVAERIEEECVYPGQIKVCVVRETQRTAVAR